VTLTIEVADTSTAYDRTVKLPLYARPEEGEYLESRRYGRSGSLTATQVPGFSPITVDDILG
jgi:hypothetical protein